MGTKPDKFTKALWKSAGWGDPGCPKCGEEMLRSCSLGVTSVDCSNTACRNETALQLARERRYWESGDEPPQGEGGE